MVTNTIVYYIQVVNEYIKVTIRRNLIYEDAKAMKPYINALKDFYRDFLYSTSGKQILINLDNILNDK